jgi:hypothetical protein
MVFKVAQHPHRGLKKSTTMEKLEAKLRSCLRFAQIRSEIRGNPKPQVTVRWLLKLWQRQRGICPIFHLKMTMKGSLGVTLDQIKPGKFYTRKNTQLVAQAANAFKGTMTMQETRSLLRSIKRVSAPRKSISPRQAYKLAIGSKVP